MNEDEVTGAGQTKNLELKNPTRQPRCCSLHRMKLKAGETSEKSGFPTKAPKTNTIQHEEDVRNTSI